ncbi:MAG TPA: hypothetical protein VMU56_03005 [Beijerinckiaceae bacterium]|nr:hypothetical protein [Beijerinckiaceae bacterium]HVB90049.1 hypothetical protein [Beijerinckiaceae bacterium]
MAIDQDPRLGDPSIRGSMTRRVSSGGPIGAIIVVVVLIAAAIAFWGWRGGAVHEGRSVASPATTSAPAAPGPATSAPASNPSPAASTPAPAAPAPSGASH